MKSTTKIHFVRHGLVQNQSGVFYGRLLGFPLADEGRDQALAAKIFLREKPIASIYCSPQLRARETANILVEPHKNTIISISELLDEVYSPFDGHPIQEVEKRNWDIYTGIDPNYEKPEDILNRAQQFITAARLGHLGQEIVAVTHGDIIGFLMLWCKGLPCDIALKQSLYTEYIAPASITTFTFQSLKKDELPKIEYVNPAQ